MFFYLVLSYVVELNVQAVCADVNFRLTRLIQYTGGKLAMLSVVVCWSVEGKVINKPCLY